MCTHPRRPQLRVFARLYNQRTSRINCATSSWVRGIATDWNTANVAIDVMRQA